MGRRNYDLTGITAGSPAWVAQQERGRKKAGLLRGTSRLQDPDSTTPGIGRSGPNNKKKALEALPAIVEEDAGIPPAASGLEDRTGPEEENLCSHENDSKDTGRGYPGGQLKLPRGRKPQQVEHAPTTSRHQVMMNPPHSVHINIATHNESESPHHHRIHPNVLPGGACEDGSLLRETASAPLRWQPMTLEEYQLGNQILRNLVEAEVAAASSVGALHHGVCDDALPYNVTFGDWPDDVSMDGN